MRINRFLDRLRTELKPQNSKLIVLELISKRSGVPKPCPAGFAQEPGSCVRRGGSRRRNPIIDFIGQTEESQSLNRPPGRIQFPPFVTCWSNMGMGVMIIVPAFTVGPDCNPPKIPALVSNIVIAIAPKVRGRIHEPRSVVDHHHANAQTPQQHRKTADGPQCNSRSDQPHKVSLLEKLKQRIIHQVRSVLLVKCLLF